MPLDKQSNGKPITPALSSNFHSNTKSPLTPRLVGSGASSPASSTRREAFVRTRSPAREPPAAKPLNGNITPRTAVRRSRIGTESPATPGSNQAAAVARPRAVSSAALKTASVSQQGLGISSPGDGVNPTPVSFPTSTKSPTPAYTIHRRVSGAKSAVRAPEEEDSKFFHVDEAKSYVSESPAASADTSSFFFVGSPANQGFLSPRLSPTREMQSKVDAKFFHANEARSQTSSKPPSRPELPNKKVSASSNAARIQHIDTARSKAVSSPSDSPKKDQRQIAVAQPSSPHKEPTRQISSPAKPRKYVDRRSSVGSSISIGNTSPPTGHQKSTSTSSISAALPTLNQRPSDPPSRTTTELPTSTPTSDTFSDPSQASSSRPQHDAANARRERKVLDLEISNSSLLAINKTLEKELRNQKVELRRFRRLSRSGRLSLAPTNRSISASTLGTLAEGESQDCDQSEVGDDSDLDTIDDDETDILSNDSSSVHSPTSRARQRARDERRLMLDLSKHQQMLLDSQKLTQSIRRCLTCTEELIKDGNKALEYKVGIGDVPLGGRVLNREELVDRDFGSSEEDTEQRRGLLSPTVTMSQLEEATLWLTSGVGSGSEKAEPNYGTLEAINAELDAF